MSGTNYRTLVDGSEITSPKLARLFEYWNGKARGRWAPTRADINPAEIPRLLPWVWLVDVIAGGTDFRFRIGGEKLIDFIGHRMAGETMAPHRDEPFLGHVAQAFDVCVSTKKPLLRPCAPTRYERRANFMTEGVLLPLSDNGTDVSQIFGGFAMTMPVTLPATLAAAPG
jgi:hypothetical protein